MTERLTTAQVARRLGVKPQTVYAYVSRGLLHRTRAPGGRHSWFDAVEVERMAARRADRAGPGPAIRTALTVIRDGKLYYRGVDAVALARSSSFESVATWLWSGHWHRQPPFDAPEPLVSAARAAGAALPAKSRLTDRLRIIVTAAACADPRRSQLDADAVAATGAGMLATMVEALPRTGPQSVGTGLAARLWSRLSPEIPEPAAVAALDAALVLLADHDLAASTVAARVAASTRAHPYAVVTAGLAAFDGPLHGAAASLAHRLLADAIDSGDPAAVYAERLRTEGRVPGFLPHVHRLYPYGDARAVALFGLLPHAPVVRAAVDGLLAAAGEGAHPNIELALAALAHAGCMGPDAGEAIFAVARTAGWIAHATEEYQEPGLRFRFTGSYVGAPPE